MSHVPVTEEFDDSKGRFVYYENAVIEDQTALLSRAHKNLRTFSDQVDEVPLTMYHLADPVEDLNLLTMEDLAGNESVHANENWTVGTYGADPALENRSTLRLTIGAGTTTTVSTMANWVDFSEFADTDEVSVALPNFPAASLNLGNSFLRLTEGASSVDLPFTGVAAGNSEAKWPLSDLGDIRRPTSVQFTFVGTGAATVTIAALRVLALDWTPTMLDINTAQQRLEPTVTRTGEIPVEEFPKLWRASETPGEDDPLPINSRIGINFNTGSATGTNSIALFFRARREDFLTQLDLDGVDYNGDGIMEYGTSQGDLNDYGAQPDYGRAMYNPHPQSDYDTMPQSTLDTYTQAELERAPDFISESWISATLTWGATGEFKLSTTEALNEDEKVLPVTLDPNENLLAVFELQDDAFRLRIYNLDEYGQIDRENIVFDTNEIRENFLLKRRKGRIGWHIALEDGDSHINSIRSRGLMFGEFITQNFESLTPVEGARLFAGSTPDLQTKAALIPLRDATVEIDTYNTRSTDGSLKITADAQDGVQSERIVFEDFENSEITFDIYYPKEALDQSQSPGLYLLNERGLFIPVGMPGLIGDAWTSIRVIPIRAFPEQTGSYSVVILQELGSTTFWIDNFVVRRRSIRWSGRSALYDPWGRGRNNWTEFRSLVNSETDGIMFPKRDRFLQIRGQALAQGATIDRVYAKPKYAELGRLIWNVDRKYRD